jgi:TPR repeat protein
MFLSKESRQSARIMGHVLNFPLYDGDCSPAARNLLAVGDVDGAIAEWRRLADLGSGRARCVLAYIALKGAPGVAPDVEEARRLASSALSGERGYANYVLACIAIREQQASAAAQYLRESYSAGFVPAATQLASLALQGTNLSAKTKSGAESMLRKAAAAGHCPARVFLCSFYLRGRFGFAKRLLGSFLLPMALIRFAMCAKFSVFSMRALQYSNRQTEPVFVEASRLLVAKERGSSVNPRYLNVLRITHIAAAALAAVVLVAQSDDHNYLAIAAWIALAAWPYALSYFVAAGSVGWNLISVFVQTFLLGLITAFACDVYIGHALGVRLNAWMLFGLTIVQSMLLMFASGYGALAAKRLVRTSEPVPHRRLVISAHLVSGLVAALAIFLRPAVWNIEYLRLNGIDVVVHSLLALLPYVAVAVFALPLITQNRWRPYVYLGILVIGTVVAVVSNSGLADVSQGVVVMAQFICFGMAAEWALDGNEW